MAGLEWYPCCRIKPMRPGGGKLYSVEMTFQHNFVTGQ